MPTLNVLFVEDDVEDTEILKSNLQSGGFEVVSQRVDTGHDLAVALGHTWDLVICDYRLSSLNFTEALSLIRAGDQDLPILLVSGIADEDLIVAAMKLGIRDYLMKSNLKRLVPAVKRELRDAKLRHDSRVAQERLQYLGNYDVLTGLPNQVLFHEILHRDIQRADATDRAVALIYLGIRRFKDINDSFGRKVGDRLLQEVTRRLATCVGEGDTIARLGGAEFTIILTDMAEAKDVAIRLDRILNCFLRPFRLSSHELFLSLSAGVAVYPHDTVDIDKLVNYSHAAMSHAKTLGDNKAHYYSPGLDVGTLERLGLENGLHVALKRGELFLHYQPIADIKTGRIVSMEALLRWKHPLRGIIPPLKFIGIAEETGLIVPIGDWVLLQACKQNKAWQDKGFAHLSIAVNVSACQLKGSEIVPTIARILRESGLEAKYLELEITESVLMQNTSASAKALKELRDMGVGISIDDFGTGYSGLNYLHRLPVNTIKIDQSFVHAITPNVDSEEGAIIKAVITLAKKLNLRIVAEGVETGDQLQFLNAHGCHEMQGYYLSRPLPADQATLFLTTQQSSLPALLAI